MENKKKTTAKKPGERSKKKWNEMDEKGGSSSI